MAQENDDRIAGLVEQARQGDREAFSEIVRLVMNQVAALTYRMTGDREAGLDIAQDTFIVAWERLAQFRAESNFLSWLLSIARNRSLNYLTRSSTVREKSFEGAVLEQISEAEENNPLNQLEGRELQQAIVSFMSTLPSQQRIAFELRFYQQLSFNEISDITGKAVGTVKTNYREAILKLKKWVKDKGYHS